MIKIFDGQSNKGSLDIESCDTYDLGSHVKS